MAKWTPKPLAVTNISEIVEVYGFTWNKYIYHKVEMNAIFWG
jgi:hypothetical protein